MKKYNPSKIEKKWQKYWLDRKTYKASENSNKPKHYQLETFPYPSAAGLHVGHPKGYIAEDIYARYMRMNGHEVLYAMGWDAFGLPTENYAIKVGKSPQEVATANINNFRRQVRMFGLSYDWDREINTSDPEYYKWTQWLFIQLYKAGLAYQKLAKVNWCPKDQTVLANEQVIDGRCERDGELVEQREMEQWFLKITNYADRLLADLNGLDWPSATIKRQQDWIGKSEGALIRFPIKESDLEIEVFTTRPDTLFGATYVVLAPEHEIITNLKSQISNLKEVEEYIEAASHKTELMRQEDVKDKTGVELKGIKAINPAIKEEIPIWIADYVLAGYGTGAIMAVPAHDRRDNEFADKYNLPIIEVVRGGGIQITETAQLKNGKTREVFVGAGHLVNSGQFNNMDSEKAKREITKFFSGHKKTQYKLRDWSVSRQRYWGVPIPMVHCGSCGIVPVPDEDLPVELPKLKDYRPKGVPPLASSEKFIKVKCPKCDDWARRDPQTLDTFVDSSWYYLRYTDPKNDKEFASADKLKHWLPVDLYIIGAEHATLHLLYARFIAKFLHDAGYLSFTEPILKLRHIGLILGEDKHKMSKSRGNVVNPDEIVKAFGADSSRLYWMFMGPLEDAQPWDTKGAAGVHRFLIRLCGFAQKTLESLDYVTSETSRGAKTLIHKTIKKISEDILTFKFNTAISSLMILLNGLTEADKYGKVSSLPLARDDFESFIKIMHPFVPHLAQEIWSELGNNSVLDYEKWPEYDPVLIREDTIKLVVQVNGKPRDVIEVPVGLDESAAKERALSSENVKKHIGIEKIKKTIYVRDRLINIVILK